MKNRLTGFSYVPQQGADGYIENYAIYVSRDGKNWGNPVVTGRFGNVVNNPVEQYISIEKADVRYVNLKVLKMTSEIKKLPLAEFKLFQ